jgi:hypothetical protein
MSPEKPLELCGICPKPSEVHVGSEATVFLMAVVNVPGRVPMIVTTPKYSRDLPKNPTPCETCSTVAGLVDEVVIKGAVDIAAEIRQNLKPKKADDDLVTAWGRIHLDETTYDGRQAEQPVAVADDGCGD